MTLLDSGGPNPALLLLHGYSDSSRSFSLLEPWLSSYRLIMPDLPGHGGSLAGRHLTVRSFADDVAALFLILNIERCVVVGHSMGAMVAMVLGSLPVNSIGGLVSISGTLRPALQPNTEVTNGIAALSDPIDPADPFFELWHACPHLVDTALTTFIRQEAAAIPAQIWKDILYELSILDLTQVAQQLSIPALCIAGSEDALFGADHRHALTSALPRCRSVILDGLGHNPHWEDPAQVAKCVDQFARSAWI